MKSVIETKNAPSAIGPYSQAICFNGILYASGQIPINPDTGDLVENDIYADYFKGTIFPARSTVEVSALPKGALVEIEVIAGV